MSFSQFLGNQVRQDAMTQPCKYEKYIFTSCEQIKTLFHRIEGNGEKGIEDLQEGAGYDPHKGLSSAQDCRDTISKIKNKFANGKYKKEATFENALQTWTQKLKEAIAREGLKRGNN